MTPEARSIREHILRVAHASGHGHIPTCFSIVESLLAVYQTMRHQPANPLWNDRDIFILSKGHAALALYVTLAHWGYFSVEEVYGFGSFNSRFGCHPDRLKVPGIEASTGSLGHGIGVSVGMATAAKLAASDQRTFTLIGDGEANEGTVWEAIMVAVHQQLTGLTIFFDNNRSQTRCMPVTDPVGKFRAFGCDTLEVDGHDVVALRDAISAPRSGMRVIVANTTKGQGCISLQRDAFAWHRRSPNESELRLLLEELDACS